MLAPPVSDDDDAEEGSSGEAPAAALTTEIADQAAQDAYIQAMVPNPIPTGEGMSGLEVSAAAAALDERLGFPSTSFMTASTVAGPQDSDYVNGSVEDIACMSTFSARAPAKRVHKQMNAGVVSPVAPSKPEFAQPFAKKAKLDMSGSSSPAQTPATIRTSLDGVSAPNPLLFGRPISFPTEAKLDPPIATASSKPKLAKVSLKPRSSQKVKSSKAPLKPYSSSPAPQLPRQVVPPKILSLRKFLSPVTSLSYSAPPCLAAKLKEKNLPPPLCKHMVKGKIEATVGTAESAMARVPAPPLKNPSKDTAVISTAAKPKNNATSATASNKKRASTSNKKKKVPASSSNSTTLESVLPVVAVLVSIWIVVAGM